LSATERKIETLGLVGADMVVKRRRAGRGRVVAAAFTIRASLVFKA